MESTITLTRTLENQADPNSNKTASPNAQHQAFLDCEMTVEPMKGYYLVVANEGVDQYRHLVRKDKSCTCDLGTDCLAVQAVANYLRAGGERAADLTANLLIPATCPICGGQVKFSPRLCSRMRGVGWICVEAARQEISDLPASLRTPGESHYWRFMWRQLVQAVTSGRVCL